MRWWPRHPAAGIARPCGVAGDCAPAMLGWARSRSRDEGRSLGYLRLNALALPLRADSVAGVWASGSLLHIPSAGMERAPAEVHRVLVPSSIAAMSMRIGDGEGWKKGGSLDGRRWFTFVDPDVFAGRSGRLVAAGFADVLRRRPDPLRRPCRLVHRGRDAIARLIARRPGRSHSRPAPDVRVGDGW